MYNSLIKDDGQVIFTWENVNVCVPETHRWSLSGKTNTKRKELLQNVSGVAKPGQLLAIMGASGTGKSTLLNVLNHRNSKSLKVAGLTKVNGHCITSAREMASISGYVQQDDLFFATLTVKEHLKFQAIMRMDRSISHEKKLQRVEDLLNELHLEKCENTLIGSAMKNVKGISGGEKRRLAFATEIIAEPALLFCDEPTSGLDSSMSVSIVECMKKLAQQGGKTIICTIHQPSSEVFQMFDRLCLLAEGRVAYFGDRNQVASFFQSQHLIVPLKSNHAEFYIKNLAFSEDSKQKVDAICDEFSKSAHKKEIEIEIQDANFESLNILNKIQVQRSSYETSSLTQLRWLMWRQSLITFRERISTRIQVVHLLILSIFLGFLYYKQTLDQDSIQNISGVLYIMAAHFSLTNLASVIHVYPPDIPIFLRENYNRLYRVINYYVSRIVVELPALIIITIVYVTIFYWLANLNNSFERFVICVVTVFFVTNVAISFGTFLSAASPSVTVALTLLIPVFAPIIAFGGLFMNYDSLSVYVFWIKYLSWIAYGYEIMNINQWDGVDAITCSNSSIVCLRNGDEVIKEHKMSKDNYALNFGLLAVLYVFWRTLTFLVLLKKSYKQQN